MSAPINPASLLIFRFGFGLFLAADALDYLWTGRAFQHYIAPQFHFTFWLFDWVQPWPGEWEYLHFAIMLVAGLCVAAGLFYRVMAVVLAVSVSQFFLMDWSYYQNHNYLLVILAWIVAALPLHAACSIDARRNPAIRQETFPTWMLWLVRFQIGVPYFYGGLAKFESDWFAGQPIQQLLQLHRDMPFVGPYLTSDLAIRFFIWGGLLFDLLIVPALLYKRTRTVAYCVSVLFHLMNSQLFNIHVFPWFMIFATTIFFEPDWPTRWLPRLFSPQPANASVPQSFSTGWVAKIVAGFLLLHVGFQLVWPLRHFCYGENSNWTERGHYFSWHMMLRAKLTALRYEIRDTQTGQVWQPDLSVYLNNVQINKFPREPEMILHFAHFLRDQVTLLTGRTPEVRAIVLTSLNGRRPEYLVDPKVDLAKEPRGFYWRKWILPQTEPLPTQPWRVPPAEWERHVPWKGLRDR